MTAVRCTLEVEMIYGRDFFPDTDDEEVIIESAKEAFVDMIINGMGFHSLYDYTQTKIVEEPS